MTSSASRKLEEYKREGGRLLFLLNIDEAKLLGIAGAGFFLDAYVLFIINPVCTMLQYRYTTVANMEGFVEAGANIGSVIGQFGFGYAADALGHKVIYGKLMIIILATIMSITTPTGEISPHNSLVYLGMWRILLGAGVDGDEPMSSSITSERSNFRKRVTMLAYVFSNQAWGSFIGSLITMIMVLEIYKWSINDRGEVSKLDGAWRIVVGLSLVSSVATLYQRLALGESERCKDSQAQPNMDEDGGFEETSRPGWFGG